MSSGRRYPVTPDEFEAFINLPVNANRSFEYIAGEIRDVEPNPIAAQIAARLVEPLAAYLREDRIAHLTSGSSGFIVAYDCYTPDVAVLRRDRQAELVTKGFNPIAPDLAIEINSPDNERVLRLKVANYLVAGTTLWIVLPSAKRVEVYTPGKPAAVLDINGTLNPGAILPSFTLNVSQLFEGLKVD
ncbi:MAG: Uma2 family endonuclease [Anaerolineae bacterium]|nr:Uma2 family endonuclease [Anaerolineae bacterium]